MSRFFYILIGLISCVSAMAADIAVPMINEDRIWIYRHEMWGPVVDYEMGFTDSRELNGLTYHRFALTKKTVYDEAGNVSSEDVFENGPGYWLREFADVGKVWLLTDGTKPVDDISATDPSKLQDFLIYDFSLLDGSEFKCVMYPNDFSESGCVTVTMNDAEPLQIDGQRCRVQIPEGSQSISGISFIQGIGTTYNGSLATPYVGGISGPHSDPSLPSLLSVLLAVKDKDGKIIYKNIDYAPDFDIVDNSKSWNYNYLDRVLTDYKSLTPGPTYSFGETETIEGTEYRPLLIDEEPTKVIMRQEDGKVYMRIAEGESVSIHGYPNNEDYNNRDLLVYDLGAAKDDTFFAVAAGEDNTLEWAELRVVETGTMPTLSGDRSFVTFARLYDGQDDGRRCTVVDGIGSISGCFYATDLGIQLAGDGFDKEILYEVTGKEGEVLYKGKSFTIGRDMVAEDRVWEYYYSDGSQSPNPERELYRWKFSGTEEKEGRTWNRLVSAGSVKWRGSDPATAVTDNTETVVALLRQEDNRVWILDDAGERLMYDFNLQPRDEADFSPAYLDVVYEYRLDDIAYKYSDLGVSGFYNFSPSGETSNLAPFTYSSNWGNVGRGDMLNLEFEEEKEGAPVRCLRNVYDLDGKVLYMGADVEVPSFAGIDSMESEEEDAPIYDMMGRLVSTMVRGGIYIRDGKKFVDLGQKSERQ